jgi:hypothetical protein
MRRTAWAAGLIALFAIAIITGRAPERAEAASIVVVNSADSGTGSFRWAIEQANSNPSINLIVLMNPAPITLLT